jgi:hypothetical protein
MANNHATTGLTPTLPTNYDYKRRIFSLRTDSSNNIINGDQWGTGLIRMWMYDTPTLDYSSANPGTSAITVALPVPAGIVTRVRGHASNAAYGYYISGLHSTDMAPSFTAAPLETNAQGAAGADATAGQFQILTNTSAQIRVRCHGDYALYICTLGWEDSL